MPELPEVQTTVSGINECLTGLTISDVWSGYRSAFYKNTDTIKDPAYVVRFKKAVVGAHITHASRRAKNVLIHLSNGQVILIHMKMTGHIMHGVYKRLARPDSQGESWRPKNAHSTALHDPFNRFIHFVLSFSNGTHMVLSDMRKFAKVTLIAEDALATSPHLSHLGPEPLDDSFDVAALIQAVKTKTRSPIKLVLMNPAVVSGIGNIYSDEILWRTGIHPLEKVQDIPRVYWPRMLRAIKETLARGISFGGDSLSDYRNIKGERGAFHEQHAVYRKTGTLCTKRGCNGTIKRITLGGRSAHFCDSHQKRLKE